VATAFMPSMNQCYSRGWYHWCCEIVSWRHNLPVNGVVQQCNLLGDFVVSMR